MKRNKLITPMLVLVCILGFYGVAFSGAGEPCPGCCPDTLPAPTHGPYLYGTFTVALDQVDLGDPIWGHYNVHIVLRHQLNQVHLFSFSAPIGDGDLCAPDASWYKDAFAKYPCYLEVGQPFGFDPAEYVPVISDLYITKRDFCESDDEMISGVVTIRLVPLVPPKPPKPPRH